MLKQIDQLLKKFLPAIHAKLKQKFRSYKKKTNPTLSREEFKLLLTHELNVNCGDTLFIHSSMRNLYFDFDKQEILSLLQELVGEEGTLAFPCWQFNVRAEDYIREHDIVFDIKNSPSQMGKIPDELRMNPYAFRSFHPTNSVIAIGKNAQALTAGHETDIYPCGFHSPFYKLIEFKAKIIGIGVTVDNLTFVHTVEDTIKDDFPIKTRNEEIYSCKCIDNNGDVKFINTLVASKAISHRDVFGFFKKHIPGSMYHYPKIKGMDFFSLDAASLYDRLKKLALENKSIYHF
jgi:aminoglycoside 3-N-acetyltransferase